MAMENKNLITSQCPFCFYDAPPPGFEGLCPACGKDTTRLIGCLRYNDPEFLEGEEARAAYHLEAVFAGMVENAKPVHIDCRPRE